MHHVLQKQRVQHSKTGSWRFYKERCGAAGKTQNFQVLGFALDWYPTAQPFSFPTGLQVHGCLPAVTWEGFLPQKVGDLKVKHQLLGPENPMALTIVEQRWGPFGTHVTSEVG